MRQIALVFIILVGFSASIFAQDMDLDAIMQALDLQGSYSETDFSAEYTVVSEKPGEERSIFRMRLFRRDVEEKATMIILEPRSSQGEGWLQIGDTAWSYDPTSREFAIFSMRENFQDSNAQNADFAGMTFSESYSVASAETGTLGRFAVYVLDLEATSDRVTTPRLKLWIRQDNYLVLKQEDYSLSNRLMRTTLIPAYTKVGEHYVASQILIADNLNEGERTQMTVREISFARIPDNVFTRSYLERAGR